MISRKRILEEEKHGPSTTFTRPGERERGQGGGKKKICGSGEPFWRFFDRVLPLDHET